MVTTKTGLGCALALTLFGNAACDVQSTASQSKGIGAQQDPAADDDTRSDDSSEMADAGANDGASTLACPAGITVALSDFISSQIALGTLTGETLSESVLSTGSSETDGLAFALSGDIALPSAAPPSGRVVVLDRFGTNVITWVDPQTAEVLGQLPVGTGFESNPQDYVEIADGLALVSRMGQNEDSGNEDFDRGGDVLVIDTDSLEIVDSLELPVRDHLPPGPSTMARVGDRVLVNMERYAADFSTTGEAMWAAVSVDDPSLEWVEPLDGLKECGRPTLSPEGSRLAMACTGRIEGDGTIEDIAQSAIVLFDPSEDPPTEIERYTAEDLVGEPIQDNIEFASDGLVLFKTQTPYGGTTNNRLLALDLDRGTVTELLEARPDPDLGGKGIAFGSIRCAPGCSNVCLMTDSDRGVLQRVRVKNGSVDLLAPLRVEDNVGLPPVGLTYR
jgi:hypothetical protein